MAHTTIQDLFTEVTNMLKKFVAILAAASTVVVGGGVGIAYLVAPSHATNPIVPPPVPEVVVLESIAATGYTTQYDLNAEFSFDGVCTANYSNPDYNKEVTPTWSTPDMTTVGEKGVVLTYTEDGITATFSYNIRVGEQPGPDPKNSYLIGLEITGATTKFKLDDEFIFDGVVTALYTNPEDNKEVEPVIESFPNMELEGNQDVILSWTDEESGIKATNFYTITVGREPEDPEVIARRALLQASIYMEINGYRVEFDDLTSGYNERYIMSKNLVYKERYFNSNHSSYYLYETFIATTSNEGSWEYGQFYSIKRFINSNFVGYSAISSNNNMSEQLDKYYKTHINLDDSKLQYESTKRGVYSFSTTEDEVLIQQYADFAHLEDASVISKLYINLLADLNTINISIESTDSTLNSQMIITYYENSDVSKMDLPGYALSAYENRNANSIDYGGYAIIPTPLDYYPNSPTNYFSFVQPKSGNYGNYDNNYPTLEEKLSFTVGALNINDDRYSDLLDRLVNTWGWTDEGDGRYTKAFESSEEGYEDGANYYHVVTINRFPGNSDLYPYDIVTLTHERVAIN